jgi:hypothetical protein
MDNRVQITRAAMPGEIHWENHFRKYKQKLKFRIFINLGCIVLIVAGQAGIFGLLYYWYFYKS